ncbi:MAG: hypothetical protein ACRC68_10260 [Clostridium sp.]
MINFKEFNNCITKINQWYKKKSKMLTVTTSPYNTTLIFSSIISEIIRNEGKILYIWGNEFENKELTDNIKLKRENLTYGFLKSGKDNLDITFTSFINVVNIRGNYELCIIDDISAFSLMSNENIVELFEGMYLYNKRIILYSLERIVAMGEKLEISQMVCKTPFVEPRIITTRINLEEDIPYALYDYLKWFKSNKRRVVIYVPSIDKIKRVYDKYSQILKSDEVKVITLSRGESTKALEKAVNMKDRAIFIVTNNYGQYLSNIKNLDVVVLFADSSFYSYKKILYLCAEAGKDNERTGEVLMVSKEISNDMDVAKTMSRDFNKKIWEKGLLRY